MKYLVTSEEMKEYDNNTIEHIGIPAMVLMERAALALRDEMVSLRANDLKLSREATVLIAVGRGNNGADGLALARLLEAEHFAVSVYECSDISHATELYRLQRTILTNYHVNFIEDFKDLQGSYDFVVDGIFGIGLTRTVNGIYEEVIKRLNQMHGIKIAIDIPSGINATSGAVMGCAFCADITVSFGFGKRGLYFYPGAEYAGMIRVANIGIDEHSFDGHLPEMFTYDENAEELLPNRRMDGNKGTFGKVLVVAGWEHMAGAAIMSAKTVLGMGAGMVKVFCSEANRSIVQCAIPEAMYGDAVSLAEDIIWADVVVAGPGMGQSQDALEVLENILRYTVNEDKNLLLDADALNLVSKHDKLKKYLIDKHNKKSKVIMTPHIGELSRLTGKDISYIKSNIVEVAKEAALDYDSIMVCKDARTYVYECGIPGYLNLSGNNGMATAGSGDVLTGVIAGLLAQGMEAFSASATGVYLHGLAGDRAAFHDTEYGVTATRIISRIEEIMKGC